MKTKYLFYILFCLFAMACSEDKGNYNYKPINDLTISGIKDKTYVWTYGTKLEIPVTLERSLSNSESNLAYRWEIDGKEVSTEKDLSTEVPAGMTYGEKVCRFSVVDKTNGMTWSKKFRVSIVSEFSWGYYFLTEKEDHSTVISFLPISDSTEIKTLLHTTSIDGITLGKYPQAIAGNYGNLSALNTYTWNMQIMTGDEKAPIITTNNLVFNITGIISANNFVDQGAGYTFKPEAIMNDPRNNVYFVSEGKIISYTKNLLYRPAKHNKEYRWAHPVQAPQQVQCGFFFDEISRKYYFVKTQTPDPAQGLVGDQFALDEVTEYPNNRYYGEESIIGNGASYSTAPDYSSMNATLTIVSAANGNIYLTDYDYSMLYLPPFPETRACKDAVVLPLAGANKDSKALLVNENWYVTAGNSIYTSPRLLPKFTHFADIPEEYGKITNIKVSAQGSRLVVVTYKEDSPEEMKGSVILIDIQSKKQYPHKNVIYRCVDMLSANAQYSSYPAAGDGK